MKMSKYIGLDFGHGENTAEAGSKRVIVNGVMYEEHHFNAEVGLIVDRRLKEHGFRTFQAQPAFKDDFPLATRTNAYNRENVDLVISIHGNASGNATANGMGIFYWKGSAEGLNFSKKFVENWKAMVKGVGLWGGDGIWESYRGSWTNFHIVRETKAVAVLIEAGFFTNLANDFKYMFGEHKNEYRNQVAEAIVKTVCDHYGVNYVAPNAPQTVPTPQEVNGGNYKVKAGDTFYSIANAHGVSVQDIQRANPTVNPRALQVGSYIVVPQKSAPAPQPALQPKGNMETDSIVTYLNSIGVDSSYANRAKLAQQYGITGYKGTADQNLKLLELMRKGATPAPAKPAPAKPAPKGDQNTNSIVTYLNSIGVNSSFANREKLAKQHGISGYRGTAEQNLLLLKKMRGH
jgi:N-acetylmuramoyl-L-alanine amidase